jgi:hypothetical protein
MYAHLSLDVMAAMPISRDLQNQPRKAHTVGECKKTVGFVLSGPVNAAVDIVTTL